MPNNPTDLHLKTEKASQKDWLNILDILKGAGLKGYMSGKETYKSFYTVKDSSKNKIIGCFAISIKNSIGIVKSFAIKKNLQGKGLGKVIANSLINTAKELNLKTLYASSWEAPEFWIKTNFKETSSRKINDSFFLNYINSLEKDFPDLFKSIKHFILLIKD